MENSAFSVPLWLISALSIREVILDTFLSCDSMALSEGLTSYLDGGSVLV